MQGTIVMMMALSGLGCHHKSCTPAYESACYSSCYSSVAYSSCYSGSCYGGAGYAPVSYSSCYSGSSCYSNACYGGGHHRRGGGLFGCFRKNRGGGCYSAPAPVAYDSYSGCGGCGSEYGAPVYGTGSYTPAVYATGQGYASAQTWSSGQMMTPSKVTPAYSESIAPTKTMTMPTSPAARMAAPPAATLDDIPATPAPAAGRTPTPPVPNLLPAPPGVPAAAAPKDGF